MNTPEHSLLGKATAYTNRYAPELLFAIARAPKREAMGLDPAALPFAGVDVWNAYELSWLDPRGKPQVAMARFSVPADSPNIIESKSFKLYLNGFAGERLDEADLVSRLRADLAATADAPIGVTLIPATAFAALALHEPRGIMLDNLDIDIDHYGPPRPDFLTREPGETISETLLSHLLKSNCPVTGQPDWGSVEIRYTGTPLNHAGLLRYLVSFREHAEFHEQCVERIFTDIRARCQPQQLTVHARYTRRGGLDINPFRSTDGNMKPPQMRSARQ